MGYDRTMLIKTVYDNGVDETGKPLMSINTPEGEHEDIIRIFMKGSLYQEEEKYVVRVTSVYNYLYTVEGNEEEDDGIVITMQHELGDFSEFIKRSSMTPFENISMAYMNEFLLGICDALDSFVIVSAMDLIRACSSHIVFHYLDDQLIFKGNLNTERIPTPNTEDKNIFFNIMVSDDGTAVEGVISGLTEHFYKKLDEIKDNKNLIKAREILNGV